MFDKEYFYTSYWCYYAILVDMKVDNPIIPIPLPENVVCSEMIAGSKPTEAKFINELILYTLVKRKVVIYTD